MLTRKDGRLADQNYEKHRLHMLGEVDQLHRDFDQLSKDAFSKATCRKGCNACCELLVLVTRTEAELIIERHPQTVVEALPLLQAQAQELWDLATAVDVPNDELATLARLRDEWWARRRPCALLAAEGTCSVYDDRPLSCRQHAVTNDPAECGSREKRPVEARIGLNFIGHLSGELQRLEAYRASVGDPALPGAPLPIIMLDAASRRMLAGSRTS